MFKHYNLTLTGLAQRLSSVLAAPLQSTDRPLRAVSFQAGTANAGIMYFGDDSAITTSDYGISIEIPSASVPAPPFVLGEFETGPLRLSHFWVLGTAGDVLHIAVVEF